MDEEQYEQILEDMYDDLEEFENQAVKTFNITVIIVVSFIALLAICF
jgi:hypothetical protein